MSELKDKEEQYNNLLNYKGKSKDKGQKDEADSGEDGENKFILPLRVILITIFAVVITAFSMYLITNYNEISSLIESFKDKRIANVVPNNKPDLTPARFNFKMLSRYQNILVCFSGSDWDPIGGAVLFWHLSSHGRTCSTAC